MEKKPKSACSGSMHVYHGRLDQLMRDDSEIHRVER